ncbi:MFS general substrate transporter [Aspergillus heteromorphus CBS 117.55]|uniref:MFS general substrate transporter n=1 Tax=Aspergillus heteromorphus CBS 117.55 TaxID=1448321 RepID=A0A317W971_9EURO|nr:MFS general substrate transporter [Aspergillus heteromorphus CBS 117.55]PWY81857.1 MFS general substrate transporter [Aspergillus heteromorphus CBS 117.55]
MDDKIDPVIHEEKGDLPSQVLIIDFDPHEHPHSWPNYRKWTILLTVTLPIFLMPLSSTILAPAVDAISAEFHVISTVEGPLTVSLFLLTYCLGPLLLGPLSELVGRVPVLQVGNVVFLAFNLAGGFSRSMTQLLVFRLLSGLGASASLATGASTIGDVFPKEERGLGLALLNMGPVLGSCLGPIAGGFITDYSTWRWAFHATSIFGGVTILTGLCLSRETYPPVLLRRKKHTLQSTPAYKSLTLLTRFEKDAPTSTPDPQSQTTTKALTALYSRTLLRSLHLLLTQPIVQALSLYYGYLYGLVYLVLSTFPTLWETQYHLSTSRGSLHYIAPCIGYLLGAQFCALLSDKIYTHLKSSNNGTGKPEFRLPLMIPASFLVPAGLFIYGWSAQYKTHWIVPDIGIALPLMGATVIFQCTNAYLLEAYSVFGASANGGVYILRGLTGFGFPMFSPVMYKALGYGWGNSILGFVALVVGCPIPWVLWWFGERLRARSSFADRD